MFLFLADSRRHSSKDAAFEIAMANPSILSQKGDLQSKAKQKVEADSYHFARKRSRSIQEEKTVKTTPNLRVKRIKEIDEDLEEANTELKLLQHSRERARNVNCDDKARVYTQEMEPVRK